MYVFRVLMTTSAPQPKRWYMTRGQAASSRSTRKRPPLRSLRAYMQEFQDMPQRVPFSSNYNNAELPTREEAKECAILWLTYLVTFIKLSTSLDPDEISYGSYFPRFGQSSSTLRQYLDHGQKTRPFQMLPECPHRESASRPNLRSSICSTSQRSNAVIYRLATSRCIDTNYLQGRGLGRSDLREKC